MSFSPFKITLVLTCNTLPLLFRVMSFISLASWHFYQEEVLYFFVEGLFLYLMRWLTAVCILVCLWGRFFYWFTYVETSAHHWNKISLIILSNVFGVFLDLVYILLKKISFMFILVIGQQFSSFVKYMYSFGIKVKVTSNNLEMFVKFLFGIIIWGELPLFLLWQSGIFLQWNHLALGFFFVVNGIFIITDYISLGVVGQFKLFLSSQFKFYGLCMCQETNLFLFKFYFILLLRL